MSRFYSFYELLNFWTLNYELGDDLHKTRWQGANIKATHRPSACVHLDSPNLSVWSFLFTMCVWLCVFPCFECICLRERETMRMHVTVRVCGWLLGFTCLELVHYSLTVLPSEIPGSGCVTQTHTHKQYIHTQTEKCTHTFIFYTSLFCILVLYWRLHRVDRSAPQGETDRGTDYCTTGYWTKPLSHFILQDTHLVTV